jgi:hypothetical protein
VRQRLVRPGVDAAFDGWTAWSAMVSSRLPAPA